MRVLFVSSGNKKGLSPVIKAQGESLKTRGCSVEYFLIKEKGVKGYLKQIQPLKKHLQKNKYEIVHAHYSFCGFVSVLAGAKPLVVSLMGSDLSSVSWYKYIIYLFVKFFWDAVIVKSSQMKNILGYSKAHVISNGVNLNVFKPISRNESIQKLKWRKDKTHILFGAQPERPVKNYKLFTESVNLLRESRNDIEVHTLGSIPHSYIPYYMNAADVMVLSSLREGSPNVIKEAMVCNRPIVCTDVGNVKWMFNDVEGCYLTDFNKETTANTIKKALDFSQKKIMTKGRERIKNLGLTSEKVAKDILALYYSVSKGASNTC